MSGGPIFPRSAFPVTASRVFPNFHVGAGANSKEDEGLGVEADLGGDAIWRLRFQMPPTLPSGTAKLRMRALANAATGAAKVDVKWVSIAVGEDASDTAVIAEGVDTFTWVSGDEDKFLEVLRTLDADTIVAGEEVVMDLSFVDSGWTLAQVVTFIVSIIWE